MEGGVGERQIVVRLGRRSTLQRRVGMAVGSPSGFVILGRGVIIHCGGVAWDWDRGRGLSCGVKGCGVVARGGG